MINGCQFQKDERSTGAGWDRKFIRMPLIAFLCLGVEARSGNGAELPAVPLPKEVKVVWDLDKAYRETTSTREQISLNGLWQWQPASSQSDMAPTENWGYFKVPGCWPGITDYMQKDSQVVHTHPSWAGQKLGSLTTAWYQRTFRVPANWSGRRICARFEYLNSYAVAFVDGQRAGEVRYPGGELDLSSICQAGRSHQLSLWVAALPLKGIMLSYTDTAAAREIQGSVPRRGLCGDVFLVSTPKGPRLDHIRISPSVRKRELAWGAVLEGLEENTDYALQARIVKEGQVIQEFSNRPFRGKDLKEERIEFVEKWMPDQLWDVHTPQNTCSLEVTLLEASGAVLDRHWPAHFGFREFWIDGRDFYLNGIRLFLSALPLDNAQVSAAHATYQGARESLERLRSFGINLVYTHNYGCEPGSHLGFKEILRAADEVGMLVSFSQPHFSHYEWQAADADQHNGYARHAEFYVRAAQNHPSVVMYSMSHNATGYHEDMNPDMIDGRQEARDAWALRNSQLALRGEAIVNKLDPSRVIYHHASGNLGSLHAINFYPNFVPIQELSDWFEHWSMTGLKPVFTCEYGAPFTWDWTMYRGWYQGKREFGSAKVPWEFCLAEWNAQFLGDRAFDLSEPEKANLRWEARQFREGRLWHRWDYPFQVGSSQFEERYPVFAMYLNNNWRAFRSWGVSAVSPWEHGHFWKLREGVDKRRQEFAVDWENLQRPGFSPDYLEQRYERMDLAFERSDWIATPAAQALLRHNRPLLACLGGKTDRFTSQDHNYYPGETVEKQIFIVNNSREAVTCESRWSLDLPRKMAGNSRSVISAGQQTRIPLRFSLPASIPAGRIELKASFVFSTGEVQTDRLFVDVLPRPVSAVRSAKTALFDPRGQTRALLDRLGMGYQLIGPHEDLAPFEILMVGKSALTLEGAAPSIERVRAGLKVLLFEQTSEVLEKRFGFRVQEYGLRQVFPRVPDHPLLAGINPEHWNDWRGEATLLPDRLNYERRSRHGPTVLWCDMPVTRLWRCGHRGNVASVLIEKPACGDFLPVLDGGYSLQYSPLLEYREKDGLVLFCQVDVTGRTEDDPGAESLVRNLLQYISTWKPGPQRQATYVGEPAGLRFLQSIGAPVKSYDGSLSSNQVLVVGPGGGQELGGREDHLSRWLSAGGNLLAIGLDQANAEALFPNKVVLQSAEHIGTLFDAFGAQSPLRGAGPADVHNRDPRILPLVGHGLQIVGNGVLAYTENHQVVFCQLAPWQFDGSRSMNLKRTHRRVSFLVNRLLANMGVSSPTPLLDRFHRPVGSNAPEKRWLTGFYLDQPEEWDDPYRFFRW